MYKKDKKLHFIITSKVLINLQSSKDKTLFPATIYAIVSVNKYLIVANLK